MILVENRTYGKFNDSGKILYRDRTPLIEVIFGDGSKRPKLAMKSVSLKLTEGEKKKLNIQQLDPNHYGTAEE